MKLQALLAAFVMTGAGLVPVMGAVDGPLTGDEAETGEVHHVHIENFDMDPSSLQIEVGDTVEWHNHDSASHTATDDGGDWNTSVLATGETETITFDEVRHDTYHCEVHPSSMTGFELDVVDPNVPPTVEITSPTEGETLTGNATVEGVASDPEGNLQGVEVRIDDGAWRTATGTTDWSYRLDTSTVSNGQHVIQARSFDDENTSEVAEVPVEVFNPDPDLTIEDLAVDEGHEATEVELTVANVGAAPAGESLLTVRYDGYYVSEGTIGEETIPALDAGGTAHVSMTWDTRDKVGEFEITAKADPADQVLDFTPHNDEQSETACVPGTDGATCAIPGTEAPG